MTTARRSGAALALVATLGLVPGLAAAPWTPSASAEKEASESKTKPTSVLDFKVKSIDGKPVDLSKFRGQVLMIVNVASQ